MKTLPTTMLSIPVLLALLLPVLATAQDNQTSANPAITSQPATATAAKSKVSWFTLDEALARAIRAQQATVFTEVAASSAENRSKLDTLGIAQLRVDANLARLQGQTVGQPSIDSQQQETLMVYRLLDDALAEISARLALDKMVAKMAGKMAGNQASREEHLAPARQARASQLILRQAMPVYWQAAAGSNIKLAAVRLQRQIEMLLEPFTLAREPQELSQRDALLYRLESVKQLVGEADSARQQLASLLALDEKQAAGLRFDPQQPLAIPLLDSAANLQQRALVASPAADRLNLDDVGKYLRSLSPALLSDQADQAAKRLAWLSSGKHLAFDLFIALDGLERQQWLRQKAEEQPALPHQLGSAALARLQLAKSLYRQSLEQFALADCQARMSRQQVALNKQRLDNSLTQQLQAITMQIRQLQDQWQRFQAYGQLLQDFTRLVDSITINNLPANLASQPLPTLRQQVQQQLQRSRQDASADYYDCYRSAELKQQDQQAMQQVIAQREQAEQELAKIEAAKKAAAAKKAQTSWYKGSQWLGQQNPRAFVLQILTSSNAKRLENYARQHGLGLGQQAQIINFMHQGKPMYSLLFGLFADRELAFVGQFQLPEKVQTDNRILTRRVSELQALTRRR